MWHKTPSWVKINLAVMILGFILQFFIEGIGKYFIYLCGGCVLLMFFIGVYNMIKDYW